MSPLACPTDMAVRTLAWKKRRSTATTSGCRSSSSSRMSASRAAKRCGSGSDGSVGAPARPADLADREQGAGLVERVEADGGPVDVLVNNAGVDLTGPFMAHTDDQIEFLYRVNLLTPVELCHQAIPRMLALGGG